MTTLALAMGAAVTPLSAQSTQAARTVIDVTRSQQRAAARVLAGSDRVAIDVIGVPLATALEELVRAGAPLAYSTELVRGVRSVTCRCAGATLDTALETLLRGTGITHQRIPGSGQILLVPAPKPVERPVRRGAITGQVTSASSGQPVSGVSVVLEGSTRGVITDRQGRYLLPNVPPGSHQITAGSVGYGRQSQEVVVTAGETVTVDFRLETEAVRLDALTVTAGTVAETSVRAIPSPVTVVTREEIDRSAATNVAELLRVSVPGLVHTYEGPTATFGRFSVRGVSSIQGAATTLKVYIDGAEVADATNIVNLDPALIERIEIISGPQASTIYGSRAMSGVMQITTLRGAATDWRPVVSGGATLTMMESEYVDGTPAGHRLDLSATGGGRQLNYTVGANVDQTPEWLEALKRRSDNLFGRANFDLGRLSGGLTVQRRRGQQETNWDPIARQINTEVGRVTQPPNSGGHNRFQTNVLNLSFDATPRWQHNLTAGYNTFGVRSYNVRPGNDGLYGLSRRSYHRRSLSYTTAAQVPLTADIASTLTFGADYTKYRIWNINQFRVPDRANYELPEAQEQSPRADAGYFGQVLLGFRDAVYFTAGARADRNPEGSTTSTTWSPRLGLSVVRDFGDLTAKTRVSWGQAVIIPGENEVLGSEPSASYTIANPDLLAQIQRGYDAGVDLYFSDRASVGVTYFDQNPINLMQLVNLGQDEEDRWVWQYQNLQEVSNRGWEVKGMVRPLDAVSVELAYGRTRSRVLELGPNYTGSMQPGQRILGQPDYTTSLHVVASPFRGTTVSTTAFRHGSWNFHDYLSLNRDFAAGTYNPAVKPFDAYRIDYPAFTKFNVGVTQAFRDNLTGILQIRNAGNSNAPEYSNSAVQEPRTISVGLRFTGL